MSEPAPAPNGAPPADVKDKKDKKDKNKSRDIDAVDDEEEDELPSTLDDDTVDIHEKLRRLRKDEIPALTQSGHNRRSILAQNSYVRMVFTETGRYIREYQAGLVR